MDWTHVPPYIRPTPDPLFEVECGKRKYSVIELPEKLLSKRLGGLEIWVYVLLGFMAEPGNIKYIPACS